MANWISITISDVKSAGHGAVIDAAQTAGVDPGDPTNPVARAIAEVTAKVRASISPGNTLDADPTKIPNSLRDLAARMCVRFLKQRIQVELTQDERDQRNEDNAYLKTLSDERIAFEQPDNPAGSAEMQQTGDRMEQQTGNAALTRDDMKGL